MEEQMNLTRHAIARGQQRGIAYSQFDAVLKHADRETPRGGGRIAVWISKKELQRIGPKTPEGVPTDRLRRLIVIQGDDGIPVTAFRNDRAGSYRRSLG
jgi:hypothetical protein